MEGFAVCQGRAGHRQRVVSLGESGFSVCHKRPQLNPVQA